MMSQRLLCFEAVASLQDIQQFDMLDVPSSNLIPIERLAVFNEPPQPILACVRILQKSIAGNGRDTLMKIGVGLEQL